MSKEEMLEKLIEALEETCFPIQIDLNNKNLYLKGLEAALEKSEINMISKNEYLELETNSLFLPKIIERLKEENERHSKLINKLINEREIEEK